MSQNGYGAGHSIPQPQTCTSAFRTRAIGCSVAASATRDHCLGFRATVSPLPVVPSFACSVASLSRFPGLERPGCQGLRPENLAGHRLGVDGARCPQELVWWFPLQSHNPSDDRRSPVTQLLAARFWACSRPALRPLPSPALPVSALLFRLRIFHPQQRSAQQGDSNPLPQ